MKKLVAFILCLTFILPAVCLAQDLETLRPAIGFIRVGDDALLNDDEINSVIDEKAAALFDDQYNYIAFNDLQPAFEGFVARNNMQNNNELTSNILLKFAKEQNLDYLLFMNFNLDELHYDQVFFKSAYRAMLGVDLMLLNADEGTVLYTNHLIADGSATDETTACRKSAAKMMRRINAHFNVDTLLE